MQVQIQMAAELVKTTNTCCALSSPLRITTAQGRQLLLLHEGSHQLSYLLPSFPPCLFSLSLPLTLPSALTVTRQRCLGFSAGTRRLKTAGAGLLSSYGWSTHAALPSSSSALPKGSDRQQSLTADDTSERDVPRDRPCGSHIVRRRYLHSGTHTRQTVCVGGTTPREWRCDQTHVCVCIKGVGCYYIIATAGDGWSQPTTRAS